MKKTKVREWTCDKCGKTVKSNNKIVYPFEIGKSRIRIELGFYYFESKKDLCFDCAKKLIDTI